MKRIYCLVIAMLILMIPFGALAEMGVQIIGGSETEAVSLDDMKLNVEATIDEYAIINLTECTFVDEIGYYEQGKPRIINSHDRSYKSGTEAEYLILRADIINLATTTRNFLQNCEVIALYDDVYQYAGWCYQYNYNYGTDGYDRGPVGSSNQQNFKWVIDHADEFSIGPMYEGHYCFGCSLPNTVVNSKAPLKMVISLDGNEITYKIR